LTKYNPEERCTLSTAVTDLHSKHNEVDEIITESLNPEQIIVESQLKINQPQEQTEQQETNIQQQNLDSKKKNEEILNQPRSSVSFPDLKNSAIEALTEQERKERRHSSAELIGDNATKSFRRSGVSFYEHPININSKLINTIYRRSTPSPSPSSKISAAPSVLTSTQQSITQSVNFQINFIEELFEFYQSQVRIDLDSFPKQLQYWLKSKQLDPTSVFDSVKNIPSQKFYESLLGMLYENGIGTSQDKTLAFHCYTMGKDNNDPISKALLANTHFIGCGTKKNVKQAYMLLKKYSNEGNIWCQFMLAEYYYNNTISINCFGKKNLMLRDTSKEAFMWYMKSAQGGYINAEYKIGGCYKKGFGAIKSNLAAFQWYLKAAINGLTIAQYKVAKWYQNGGDDGGIGEQNGKKDESEAFKWYLRAASNRYEKAMKIVAEEYEYGYHVDKDLDEARRWYEQAFLLGLDWAYVKLKQWCEKDIIVSKINYI
jgi:TPR repeat protein